MPLARHSDRTRQAYSAEPWPSVHRRAHCAEGAGLLLHEEALALLIVDRRRRLGAAKQSLAAGPDILEFSFQCGRVRHQRARPNVNTVLGALALDRELDGAFVRSELPKVRH